MTDDTWPCYGPQILPDDGEETQMIPWDGGESQKIPDEVGSHR